MYSEKVPFHQSFGYTQKGDVVIYNNELMRVAVAVNQGNFCQRYNLDFGPDWQVEFKK